jgi:two-component system response regulator FixJ
MKQEDLTRAVYVVDDDREVRLSLSFQLSTLGYTCTPFGGAADFLDALEHLRPGCILLDIRMAGMDGIDALAALQTRDIDWPVVMMTGHGDVPVAVAAMKGGAIELLEKPFEEVVLIAALDRAFEVLHERLGRTAHLATIHQKLRALSPRERDVLAHITAGEPNKRIADALGLSVRTVEMHRASLLSKLGVKSTAEAAVFGLHLGPPARTR